MHTQKREKNKGTIDRQGRPSRNAHERSRVGQATERDKLA
jgi:hypothetical protein